MIRKIIFIAFMREFSYAGMHIIADFWFPKEIRSKRGLKNLLRGAARASKSTPLKLYIHLFHPQGMTGILLLEESHIALHSWPEVHYLGIDIFTCGKIAQPKQALKFLKKNLRPKKVIVQEIKRGDIAQSFKSYEYTRTIRKTLGI